MSHQASIWVLHPAHKCLSERVGPTNAGFYPTIARAIENTRARYFTFELKLSDQRKKQHIWERENSKTPNNQIANTILIPNKATLAL